MADARTLWPVVRGLKIVGLKVERMTTSILLEDGSVLVCDVNVETSGGGYDIDVIELETYIEPPDKPISGWYTNRQDLIAEDDDECKCK